ncbi:hypothetical protein [Kitasatospora sp. NPDC088783]|uniref:hypothetical protein n=1 Tax=Kitasatospora sp. NPDC088783 TaxID=3364077 RepID=UPI0038215E8D
MDFEFDAITVGQTGMLFGRGEVRDAIDAHGLLAAVLSRDRLLDLVAWNEAGFDRTTLVDTFR